MEFRIADTFTDSLTRLTGDEQKAVKTTAFDLQMNPANPGMSFHKLDRAKDKNFWSVRVNRDIRLIVHRTPGSLLLCYVGHHDDAYEWAERRKLETHPTTGAAQLVEIRETVKEIVIPVYVPGQAPVPYTVAKESTPVLAGVAADQLLRYGVPEEWIEDVLSAGEDTLLAVADHLPAEAAEAVLELATGGTPRVVDEFIAGNPFDHPDAQRRFRVMSDVEELERAFEYPWEKWTVFLHPDQRRWVECGYSGPARVSGSAGTGKTIVALHRAAHLARANPDARVLLTTFSDALASAVDVKLRTLVYSEPRLKERIDVYSLPALGLRLYTPRFGGGRIASDEEIRELVVEAAGQVEGHKFPLAFLVSEWTHVVDAWQLESWEDYRDVRRLGRKTRLGEAARSVLWSIFEPVQHGLKTRGLVTEAGVFTALTKVIPKDKPIFDYAVIDEAQDLGVAHLRFFAALGGGRPDALFFAGDLGQRIFQQPFSWKSLGVDVRGRSRTLRVNYRTSHQIRSQADRLLESEVRDADGNTQERSGTVSVFNGPPPVVQSYASEEEEVEGVSAWLSALGDDGVPPGEVGVFVRSAAQLPRVRAAVEKAGLPFRILDERVSTSIEEVSISTMHLAKGLEFRAVAVMACDDEVIPLQERIEAVGDPGDLREVYDTERHLLYVACTRARDHLLVTSTDPRSEFLDDLSGW